MLKILQWPPTAGKYTAPASHHGFQGPHALNLTSSLISFSYFVPLAHRALAMLACHRALVRAMLSAWNALLQLFIHTADFRSQLQYPQALGHLKNSLALCPDARYNLSLL